MPISRYGNLPFVVTDENKPRLASPPYIKPEDLQSETDIIITWNDSMRMDVLAHNYLGDGRYWWAICLLNGLNLPFFHELVPGTLIRIPTDINYIMTIINNQISNEL